MFNLFDNSLNKYGKHCVSPHKNQMPLLSICLNAVSEQICITTNTESYVVISTQLHFPIERKSLCTFTHKAQQYDFIDLSLMTHGQDQSGSNVALVNVLCTPTHPKGQQLNTHIHTRTHTVHRVKLSGVEELPS